ncbi:MAG: hypothetical protein L0I76_05000 [Pseudonocardia sp.]|nr:hypothetical protein [Pseudonocardia sp.]
MPDLGLHIADALDEDHPLALLELVSALLSSLEPRSPLAPGTEDGRPTRAQLMDMFMETDARETSAVLAVIAEFSGDDVLRRRIRREIGTRGHPPLPGWLTDLARTVAHPRAIEVVHVLCEGDDLLLGARLPDGSDVTATIYVDHNLGTVVKDAFVMPVPVDELAEKMREIADDPDTEVRDLDPADARARTAEGIEHGARVYPPLETETWPACRPLVEWLVAHLPAGGNGYERREWDDTARGELAERFLAAAEGTGFDDPDHRHLLDTLLWYGTDYGPGDPLRWNPVSVEILLTDWVPRKIVAPVAYLDRVPDLLRALIRFGHRELGLRASLTVGVLAAVEEYEGEYRETIRRKRHQGPMALLESMGLPVGEPDDLVEDDDLDPDAVVLESLGRAVGGRDALENLTADPLPDEPFDWESVPADVHERVGQVLALVDDCCTGFFGATAAPLELRTACRRLLARVAAGDPAIFRRRGTASGGAAALCWIVGKANGLVGTHGADLTVKDMMARLGVSGSPSQRAESMLAAIGVGPHAQDDGGMDLGSPDYLTSASRAEILLLRDRYGPPS